MVSRIANLAVLLVFTAALLPAQNPSVNPQGIVNLATSKAGAGVAPGELVSIFGTNLAASTVTFSGATVPTQLGGTQVFFGGLSAPLFYVSPNQINAQVPL